MTSRSTDRLDGKVSIITGSTTGLGEAMARRFAAEGARVVVSGRSAERGAQVVEDIVKQGGEACFIPCDLADEGDIKALVAKTLERHGRLDNLVANAALTANVGGEKGSGILDLDNDLLDQSIAVNVRGLLWLFKHSLPALVESARPSERKTSSIIGIGTSGTRNGAPGMPIYFSTKAPIEVMVRSLASEFGGRGVRVNCVSAGLILTASELERMTDEFRRYVESINLLPYFGAPEDIAAACAYLASDEAAYVTGTTLCVNGGVAF